MRDTVSAVLTSEVVTAINGRIAMVITNAVGTMWCAYVFAGIALISLPSAIQAGTAALIAWIAQTFLQLVLLSVIMVGQKVAAAASDKQALQTYKDAEAVLKEAEEIQKHLLAQDEVITAIMDHLQKRLGGAAASPTS